MVEEGPAAKASGARERSMGCTHAVCCGDARVKLEHSEVKEVVVTDTVPHSEDALDGKVTVLSVAELLGEAIKRIHEEESLSSLFV